MAARTRHVSVRIAVPADEVYAFASDPAKLPEWASGLAQRIERVDGVWVADSPVGEVTVEFAEPNPWGVCDHIVTLPSGEVVTNPMRVIAVDDSSSEVLFTLCPRPGMSAEQVDDDEAMIAADLERLRRILEDR